MPKESNHKRKDRDVKDFVFEKVDRRNNDKKKLKESLQFLNSYVDTHKKNKDCCVKKDDKKDNKKECCCEADCAKCIVASREACDAPEINKLINTVYTTIPCFQFPENGTLVPITGNNEYDFSYYISLPCDSCDEIRLLWPLVWMIPQIIQRLKGRFSGTGVVIVKLLLNVLSKKLIKAPAQAIPTLNTGGVVNGPCICDSSSAAVYDYTFNFNFTAVEGGPSTVTGGILTFSAPNTPVAVTFTITIDPVTGAVTLALPNININLIAAILPLMPLGSVLAFLASVGISSSALTTFITNLMNNSAASLTVTVVGNVITLTGSNETTISFTFPAQSLSTLSPAHYVSFVASCDKEECDGYWVATNIETLRV